MESRQKAGTDLGLPELGVWRYVAGLMMETGWCAVDGMGNRQPLPWTEIVAFASHAGLTEWERSVVRAMSVAYLDGLSVGEEPGGIAPTATTETAHVDKAALGRGIMAALRMAAPAG